MSFRNLSKGLNALGEIFRSKFNLGREECGEDYSEYVSEYKLLPETEKLFNLANIVKFAIHDDLKNKIKFQENLVIGTFEPGSKTPSPVGGMCLDVNLVDDKFVVHLCSHMFLNGVHGGSKITSILDTGLHTLEEKRYEYIRDEVANQQNIYIALHNSYLFVKHTMTNGPTTTYNYKYDQIDNLICEGANFILMRCLALKKFKGDFEMSTFYLNGELCRNIYKCTGPENGFVNGLQMKICKIYRSVIERCGLMHNSCTVMTVYGQIVCHDWDNCPHSFYINPLTTIVNHKLVERDVPLTESWQDDMELFSKYLDEKDLTSGEINTYFDDHKEIKELLADYVTKILQVQPNEPFDFTIDYFRNFS